MLHYDQQRGTVLFEVVLTVILVGPFVITIGEFLTVFVLLAALSH